MRVRRCSRAAAALIVATLAMAPPSAAIAGCGEECDARYSSEIDDCRSQYGDDPADADDLASCIQDARDDYRSCLDDCPALAIATLRRGELIVRALTGTPGRRLTRACYGN
jgi:hypothetical protein